MGIDRGIAKAPIGENLPVRAEGPSGGRGKALQREELVGAVPLQHPMVHAVAIGRARSFFGILTTTSNAL